MERVFLGNSGTEVAEGAIKIARKNAFKNGRGGKIITVTKAFHGRTMVALAATGKEAMLKGFDPIPGGFIKVPFNDIEAIKNNILQPDFNIKKDCFDLYIYRKLAIIIRGF